MCNLFFLLIGFTHFLKFNRKVMINNILYLQFKLKVILKIYTNTYGNVINVLNWQSYKIIYRSIRLLFYTIKREPLSEGFMR